MKLWLSFLRVLRRFWSSLDLDLETVGRKQSTRKGEDKQTNRLQSRRRTEFKLESDNKTTGTERFALPTSTASRRDLCLLVLAREFARSRLKWPSDLRLGSENFRQHRHFALTPRAGTPGNSTVTVPAGPVAQLPASTSNSGAAATNRGLAAPSLFIFPVRQLICMRARWRGAQAIQTRQPASWLASLRDQDKRDEIWPRARCRC